MSVWVTGDVHGSIDIGKLSGRRWPEGKGLTRDDPLIVCGDFGMPWDGSNEERYWLGWLAERPARRAAPADLPRRRAGGVGAVAPKDSAPYRAADTAGDRSFAAAWDEGRTRSPRASRSAA